MGVVVKCCQRGILELIGIVRKGRRDTGRGFKPALLSCQGNWWVASNIIELRQRHRISGELCFTKGDTKSRTRSINNNILPSMMLEMLLNQTGDVIVYILS